MPIRIAPQTLCRLPHKTPAKEASLRAYAMELQAVASTRCFYRPFSATSKNGNLHYSLPPRHVKQLTTPLTFEITKLLSSLPHTFEIAKFSSLFPTPSKIETNHSHKLSAICLPMWGSGLYTHVAGQRNPAPTDWRSPTRSPTQSPSKLPERRLAKPDGASAKAGKIGGLSPLFLFSQNSEVHLSMAVRTQCCCVRNRVFASVGKCHYVMHLKERSTITCPQERCVPFA